MNASNRYPSVSSHPNLPEIERAMLDRWDRNDTFQRSVDLREAGVDGDNEFVFYDGPPFANGLPHYGHLLTGYVKDAVPRYQTMRGRRVERRFGWDCHGLPAEVQAEKELGISGHPEINAFGIDRFNDACRIECAALHRGVGGLRHPPGAMGRFRATTTRRSIWTTWRASCGRSSRCGTRVSSPRDTGCWRTAGAARRRSATPRPGWTMSYRDRQDPALTVWFRLDSGERILAWTTTPWTLPSNLALAVGPDIDYAVMEEDGQRYILAESRLGRVRTRTRRRHCRSPRSRVPSWSVVGTSRCSTTSPTPRTRSRSSGRRLRDDRGRHRRRAHGARLRRGRPDRPATRSASRRCVRWTNMASTPPRSATGSASTCSTPTRTSSGT